MRRRDFLRSVAAAGGAVLGGSLLSACMGEPPGASTANGQETDGGSAGGSVDGLPPDRSASDRSSDLSPDPMPDGSPATPYVKPNILFILVDQMRYPAWPSQFSSAKYVPNIASLRAGGVSFSQHYVATSPCSPSRASLLTGLYPRQHNLLTNVGKGTPSLDPRFPTYGTLLRDHFGYRTAWFGKWHLSPVNVNCTAEIAKPYGFGHFGCRPEDTEAIGVDCDPSAAGQFATWIAQQKGNPKPFCATVSLINPHDVCYFGTATLDGNTHPPVAGATEKNPPSLFPASTVPQNRETSFSSKPRLQQRIATNGVPLPAADCARFLDLYLLLHQYLDYQMGRVLDALEQAGFGSNTIVLFTSDHGEYGGAHGLKGKGRVAYQEGIRIPFYVRDPTGQWIPNQSKGSERAQLSSQVVRSFRRALRAALDDGDELQVTGPHLFQELIDLARPVGVVALHDGQRVELDAVPSQRRQPGHHPIEARPPGRIPAMLIVELPRPVDRDPHQERVPMQERAPAVIEEDSVGLEGVRDRPAAGVLLLEGHHAFEELQAHQRRLPTLPGEGDNVLGGGLEVGRDQSLEHLVGHAVITGRGVEAGLLQVEAIGAAQVASRTHRFHHQLKRSSVVHGLLKVASFRGAAQMVPDSDEPGPLLFMAPLGGARPKLAQLTRRPVRTPASTALSERQLHVSAVQVLQAKIESSAAQSWTRPILS